MLLFLRPGQGLKPTAMRATLILDFGLALISALCRLLAQVLWLHSITLSEAPRL